MLVDISIFKKNNTHNFFYNAINLHDWEINFFKNLSDWFESWAQISDFCSTKQTYKVFVTLREQVKLMQELLEAGYEYIFTRRLQTDPFEN